ncbi:GAF domain-containing protein [Bordetella sp. 2513F-2]
MQAASLPIALPDAERLAAACAGSDATALYAEVDAWAREGLAHTLCTINRFDPERMTLQRLYSSDPVSYPPGGTKDKRGMPWGRHVLLEQRVYVGEGEDAIRASFDDHQAIVALGLRSVINVPLVVRGQCLGTLNFLMPDPAVGAFKVACARLAGQFVLPGLMACS